MSDLKSETEEERWMRRAFESLHKPIPDILQTPTRPYWPEVLNANLRLSPDAYVSWIDANRERIEQDRATREHRLQERQREQQALLDDLGSPHDTRRRKHRHEWSPLETLDRKPAKPKRLRPANYHTVGLVPDRAARSCLESYGDAVTAAWNAALTCSPWSGFDETSF